MIVETVLNLIVYVILWIVSLFPTIPRMNLDFLNGVIRVLSLIDMFVSLRVVSVCLLVLFAVLNIRLIWSVIMWVVRKLPFMQ